VRQLQKLKNKLKYLLYIGSFFFLQIIYSQEGKSPFFYSENGVIKDVDTNSLYKFHEYRIDNEYLWLGNNGQAKYSLIFNPEKETQYSASHLLGGVKEFSYKKYNVVVPFTAVKFVQGARQEQFFNLVHTQNFAKNGNFSFGYDKINSDGSYLRQKTNNNKLNTSVWYKTPNNKFEVSFFANRIKNTVNQNGGIENDSAFIINTDFSTNRKTITINLDSASEEKIANQLALYQTVRFFDNTDSLGFGLVQKIELKSKFTNSKRHYIDENPNVDFYEHIFLDSTITNDSIKLNEVEQEITYHFELTNNRFSLLLSPRTNYYFTDYTQADDNLWLNELSVGTEASFENSKFSLVTDIDYFLLGYRQNNYQLKNKLSLDFTKNIGWYFSANLKKYSPSLDLLKYYGNHSIWENNFIPTESISVSTGTENNKWDILASFTYTDIKNPIYFNYTREATQSLDYTQVIQTSLEKVFRLKKWRITPKAVYQYTGGVMAYRLPSYFTSLKLGYGFNLFKNSLALFTGVKLMYYDQVQLMSYSPSLGQFYLGNNNDKQVGNYPFLDFFINARIKEVRLFFALTHLNEGITTENNYFGAVGHPLEDRAYKVGISWIFKK
jgi:hypothetical protein